MAAGRKGSKCVSWAPDLNLCQVRLFLSEDAPALSGLASQDHLQTKTSWLWHSNGVRSDDSLPPGFEARPSYQLQKEIARIPLITWQYPLKLNLNPEWLVVSGEESSEVAFQDQRQRGVLEAIYPRPSSIPPNPFTPEPGDTSYNDDETPIVPITAIEEEDPEPPSTTSLPVYSSTSGLSYATRNSTNLLVAPRNLPNLNPVSMQLQASNATLNAGPSPVVSGSIPGVEPDIQAAAFAAFTAMVKSNNADSMIDRELLIQILSDPKMVEKLLSEYGTSKQTSQPLPMVPPPLASAAPSTIPLPPVAAPPPLPPMVQVNRALPEPPRYLPPPLNPWSAPTEARKPTNDVPSAIPPKDLKGSINQEEVKNITYYKSLIQRHGGDRLDAMDPNPPVHPHDNRENYPWNNSVLMGGDLEGGGGGRGLKRKFRQKFAKPCVYFNTPRGCKHGGNCLFQHDPSSVAQQMDGRGGGKRTKIDRDSS